MFRKFICFVIAGLTAGCNAGSPPTLDVGLDALKGRSISKAIDVLGLPHSQTTIAGQQVYRWSVSRMVPNMMPTISQTTGYVGQTPVNMVSTGSVLSVGQATCDIRISTDARNIITNWSAEGNNAGCHVYRSRLNAWLGPSDGVWHLNGVEVPENDGGALARAKEACNRATGDHETARDKCMAARGYVYISAASRH